MPNARFCGGCGFRLPSEEASAAGDFARKDFENSAAPPNNEYQNQPTQNPQTQNPESTGAAAPPAAENRNETFRLDADGRGAGRGYTWEIRNQGSFALAVVNLQPEQAIAAEAGAMVSMSANIDLHSEMKGGVFGALKRAVGGESAFVSTFTAKGQTGEVTLAPGAPGDIVGIEMNRQKFMVQSSSYLAGDISLAVETRFGGAKSWLGGEGLFLLEVSGSGLLLVSSFGAIQRKFLRPGEQYVVDTGHLVAWEASMQYSLEKAAKSGFFRSFLSGEGMVAKFSGPGELLMQTRNLRAFAGLLRPFFPSQGGGSGGGFNIDFG